MASGSTSLFRRPLQGFAALTLVAYLGVGGYYSARQESYLFFPEKLAADFAFTFREPFEELSIEVEGGVSLSALLFEAELAGDGAQPNGAVYYLHGNGGSLKSWGPAAGPFTRLGYDVLMVDYRGYGKSGGEIESEAQLYSDAEAGYRWLTERYAEERIVVVGYSLGTAFAARVGCGNRPRQIVLHAPFFSIIDAAHHAVPILSYYPDLLFRFPLRTNEALARCAPPVAIFHGERDDIIPIAASEKLSKLFKPGDRLIPMPNGRHGDLRRQPEYDALLREILENW